MGKGRICGTTNSPNEYSFMDRNASVGKYLYRIKQVDRDGKFNLSQSVEVEVGTAPKELPLLQNYPNPFNPVTTIGFTIPVDGMATLKIYNTLGEEVATLVNEYGKEGEYHQIQFDASKFTSGIYFTRLQSGDKIQLRKILLLK